MTCFQNLAVRLIFKRCVCPRLSTKMAHDTNQTMLADVACVCVVYCLHTSACTSTEQGVFGRSHCSPRPPVQCESKGKGRDIRGSGWQRSFSLRV